jgi:ATP-dependent helicase/nuclease subunit A
MNAPREIPPAVIERQTTASNPDHSAWVSANAGSGKTHVLAQRVVRLLLSGVEPARILCITFTKAAAANMANKVFQDLRAWTMLDDAALDVAMKAAGVKKPDPILRARARQLFALALETPGGLKVQTIHAFCTQLLHLFPFEANVAARFEVLDESAEMQMLGKLSLDVMLQAAEAPDTALGRALTQAVLASADVTFQDMVREAIRARDRLTRWVDEAGGLPQAMTQLSQLLDVGPQETAADVDAAIFEDSPIKNSEWSAVAAALAGGTKTDKEQGARFHALTALSGADQLENYLDIFCTKKRDKTKERIVTKAVQDEHPDLCTRLNDERDRVWRLVQRKRAIATRDRSVALFTVAYAVIARFRAEKDRRGPLDYDDLIDKTLDLLRDERAAWVHYKLDRGIHHVLIDEAQDTSPKQWEIVRALVSEFFAGLGAHDRQRTIFAVGDEKQSIFSFQGAAPREFAANRDHFQKAHARAELNFVATEFKHSFRSGPTVLGAVDTVFARAEAFAGLTADRAAPVHEALPDAAPGLVEIWPLEQSDDYEKQEGWAAPFDVQTITSGTAKLARRIAGAVAAWRRQGRRPKDVLVLLRRRGAQFEAIIRALKQENIPVAGADRLVLTEHIAVMDLMVLADAILLPQDDLALATVLKSPLFGLDDDALFKLAWNRKSSLYDALRTQEPKLAERFDAMRAVTRDRTPFAFYAWLLGAEKGRQKILVRLGHEANDALDEFLSMALDYERTEAPSLQGFVAWLRAAKAEVKRDMEMERDEVRVMTVHGAKGLEAPIVILADTTTPPQGWHPPRLLRMAAERPVPGAAERLVWAGSKDNDVGPMVAARETTLNDAREEYRRLLYVAMTRAAERLVVCGTRGKNKIPNGCWYQLVDDALRPTSVGEKADDGGGEILRFRKQNTEPAEPQKNILPATIKPATAPAWLTSDVSNATSAMSTITPSSAEEDDARTPASDDRGAALLRGSLVHRLMQSLPDIPAANRGKAADNYLARAGAKLDTGERMKLAEQVMLVLQDPHFYELYGAGSRAEVPIVGRLQFGGKTVRVSGQIDRLAVTQGSVLIADFKTSRPAPRRIEDVPPSYLRQLALYRAVLTKLYPEKFVRAALIWTEVPDLMELSAEVLDAAQASITFPR